MKFISSTAFLAFFCCTVSVAQNALPDEVADVLAGITGVTRDPAVKVTGDFDDIIKGNIRFSQIDFGKSDQDPLAFALANFAVDDPAGADDATVTRLEDSLDVYLVYEGDVRVKGDRALLDQAKVPKFFLQFMLARIQEAKGQEVAFNGGVENQRGKVQKNAAGAAPGDLDRVAAL